MFLRDNFIPDLARVPVRHPVELGHQFHRPNPRRRIFMTGEAESHVERLFLMNFDFLIDAPVAFDAAHSRRDVRLVVKIDEVGEPVNLNPRNRLAGRETLPDHFEARAGRLDLGVAVHAGLRGRDCGVGGFVDRIVTIEAVQAQLARMQFMAVRYRLDRLIPGIDYSWVGVVGVSANACYRAQTNHGAENFQDEVR